VTAFYWSVFGFAAGLWLGSAIWRPPTRLNRRPGYVKPPVSVGTSHGTVRLVQISTSSATPLGGASVETDGLALLDPWSRRIGPISSGSETGDHGGNGQPPDSADSGDAA